MSAAMLIGMADTIMNGNRPAQAIGLAGAFGAAVLISPVVGGVAALAALTVARIIGRSDEPVNAFDMVMSAHQAEKKEQQAAASKPGNDLKL